MLFLVFLKKPLWRMVEMTPQLKFVLIGASAFASILAAYLSRNKSMQWTETVNEYIRPLVWIFGTFIILSVPLLMYYSLGKGGDKQTSQPVSHQVESAKSRPNILLVTFDALAASDMSAYGYLRPTTPFIDTWSKNASLFSRVEAESNYTTPITTSLMTGKRVWTHQTYFVEVVSGIASKKGENFPSLLKNAGYLNMALQQIHRASVRKMGIADKFEIVMSPDKFSYSTNLYRYIDMMLYKAFGDKILSE
jgi:glucan phosphoethanolaminetransferase (alkaline phosphatase superfamily)